MEKLANEVVNELSRRYYSAKILQAIHDDRRKRLLAYKDIEDMEVEYPDIEDMMEVEYPDMDIKVDELCLQFEKLSL